MKRMLGPIAAAAALLLTFNSAAVAASKEQQLLMAELRMMQQHQQQLQQMVAALADTLKTVTGKMDDQAATNRKALADQRLIVENVADTVRALREKSDDTNVRLSSMVQEIETMRQTIASMPQPAPVMVPSGDPGADPAAGVPPAGTTPPAVNTPPRGVSAQQTYDTAYSDFTAGQYELAVSGFQTFLRYFPKHPSADDAQLNIGNALYNAGKYSDAVRELQRVISDHPKTESVPQAYYKLGVTYSALKQYDDARKAYETLMKMYDGTSDAVLAKQNYDRLPK